VTRQDITILEDNVSGLKQKLRNLRNDKALFDKAKGMDEQAEKMRADAEKLRAEASAGKAVLDKLMEKKNAAMAKSVNAIMARMNQVLPAGKAVIDIGEDGSCLIGWNNGTVTVAYAGLSGGEKVAFDVALVYALRGNILLSECAEMDAEKLAKALEQYGKTELQCIVSSCHDPVSVPEGWGMVRL